jgi:hypothetical protein
VTGDVPVLFVAGKGRSGSTVLSTVLGELDGVFAAGELRFLWRRGVLEDRRCGCGRPFGSCPLWRAVVEAMGSAPGGRVGGATAVATAHDRVFRWPAVPRFLVGGRAVASWPELVRWTGAVSELHRALVEVTGARLVVDSSKWPADPAMLGLVPGIRPVVVQLVRDPRAVAWSWQRRRAQYDRAEAREMDRFGPWHSGASWVARNAVVEAVAARWRVPRFLLRYEDFVHDPAAAIRAIGEVAEVDLDPTGVVEGRSVRRSGNHTAAGNPNRFEVGPLELRPDEEWRDRLPRRDRWVVEAVTAPLLGRYGYRLRSAGGRDAA